MSICRHHALDVAEGDGVTLRRLMPIHGMRNFDPFVLWDHFDISGGGFPDHPHRGFEAITYLFDGGMNHADNLGHRGTVYGGGAQRFTAGSGIIHSEMPDGHAHGIQLWINLPRRLKRIDAEYQQVDGSEIPETEDGSARIRHIVGRDGPIQLHTEVEYLDVKLPAGVAWRRQIEPAWRGIVYVIKGSIRCSEGWIKQGGVWVVDGEQAVSLEAQSDARLMWCFGCPHHEPIHQHGPFVD